MALQLAIGLAVLGVAAAVVGIVALRDDAPRWTLKIKRPGWLLTLGFASLILAYLVNAGRYDIADDVSEFVGQEVECENVGEMDVEGQRRDVYACVDDAGHRFGCFVRSGDTVVDVSRRAEDDGTSDGTKPDC